MLIVATQSNDKLLQFHYHIATLAATQSTNYVDVGGKTWLSFLFTDAKLNNSINSLRYMYATYNYYV